MMPLAMMRPPGMLWGSSLNRCVMGCPGMGLRVRGPFSWLSGARFSWRAELDLVVVSGLAAGAAPVERAEAEDAALGAAQPVTGVGDGDDVVQVEAAVDGGDDDVAACGVDRLLTLLGGGPGCGVGAA